jgi:hypothetical protein
METSSRVVTVVDQLIDLFNRRGEDLPDGLFDRRTQFLLNGVSFEDRLGRSPSDPLVLMLARGPAGYRFALKAILHAVPDARLQRGDISQAVSDEGSVARWQCWLSGRLRGTDEAVETVFDAAFDLRPTGLVQRASIVLPEPALARIREARMRS